MPSRLQPATRTDFSGGIDAVSSPYQIGPKQVMRATNLILDEQGALDVRDGATTIDQGPSESERILSLDDVVKVSGTLIKLAVVRWQNGSQHLYERLSPAWAVRGLFSTAADLPQMLTFVNLAIVANGYETIKYYDGTTFGSLTAAPQAQHIAVHLNSLWAWNTAAATTSTTGPSSLQASDVANPNAWPLPNQVFIAKDDGQEGMGLGVFTVAATGISPTATLVAFKNFSTYQVFGLFGASNFQVVQAQTNMGCVAPRTIQYVPGLGLVRLTHRGFAVFNGLQDEVISEPIRPYIFGRDDITGLNWDLVRHSWAAEVQNPPLYLCVCPSAGSTSLDRMFVYDVPRKAWTIATFPRRFATLASPLTQGVLPQVYAGESGGGRVQALFTGQATDDGALIPWSVRFQPLPSGSPLRRGYHRRMLLKLFRVQAGQAIMAAMALGPAQSLTYPTAGASITKTLSVGASAAVGAPLAHSVDADLLFDIGATGEVLYVELSGSGKMSLRACEWHAMARPL